MGFSTYKDASIYRQLLGDPTQHMSESIGHFIEDLHSQNYIDKHTHFFLNIENTSFSKSASLVDRYVLELNTLCGDGPCEVYGRVAGIESVLRDKVPMMS